MDLEVYDAVLNNVILPYRRIKDDWDIYGKQLSWKDIYQRLIVALDVHEDQGIKLVKEVYSRTS
jgi:hypothetical protein